ncbi:MAG: efflux RND transporter periplasmic adaptor subunit [Pirellulales bacterium]
MSTLLRFAVVMVALGVVGAAAYSPVASYWKARSKPNFREVEVTRGDIASVVNATGTIQPVLKVAIGSFVSGPITALHVQFNTQVKEGDLMAEIDPRIYKAAVDRDLAVLATRKAEVERSKAQLQQAINDEKRARALREENRNYLSDSEMDQFRFNRMALEAALDVAEANVLQAQANLENSELNLQYTKILSPVDGMVIDRKIDPGQTLAAQFQTPELFVVALDMRKKMFIHANVDEADIGYIREAQQRGSPVEFTVDAYREDLFDGMIEEVRFNSTTTQNVVTYPVIVAAPNPDLKLLPGMTATISFQIEKLEDVIQIPNSALRYYPDRSLVREVDRDVLDGAEDPDEVETEQATSVDASAADQAEARRANGRRHVWVADGHYVKPIEVEIGISDHRYTQLVSGDLKPEQKLVSGIQAAAP